MLAVGGSPGRGRGLSVRDPNVVVARPRSSGASPKALPSKAALRSSAPRGNWAPAESKAEAASADELWPSVTRAPPAAADNLGWALQRWRKFRAVRLRHVRLLTQVRCCASPVLLLVFRIPSDRSSATQALHWRLHSVVWAWAAHTAAQRLQRNPHHHTAELLTARLLALLGRRRRRIFERWHVWAAHSAQLAAGEERAVIAGQAWRAARSFHGWREWARASSVSADLSRFRQHQCLGCWQAVAGARIDRRERAAEVTGWRSARLLQTSLDKLWVSAARRQRFRCIMSHVAQLREDRTLEQTLAAWRLESLAAVERREARVLAVAFHRENILNGCVTAWRAEAQILRRYGQALTLATERTAQRTLSRLLVEWRSCVREDLAQQRYHSVSTQAHTPRSFIPRKISDRLPALLDGAASVPHMAVASNAKVGGRGGVHHAANSDGSLGCVSGAISDGFHVSHWFLTVSRWIFNLKLVILWQAWCGWLRMHVSASHAPPRLISRDISDRLLV